MVGYQQELGLERRFLYQFQEPVGGLLVHLFGKIDDNHPVASLKGAERKLVQQPLGLADGDEAVLALDVKRLQEFCFCERGLFGIERAQLRIILLGYGVRTGREDEVEVRMDQFAYLAAGRAGSARLASAALSAAKVLQEGDTERECATAVILVEEDGVRDTVTVDHVPQSRDNGLISTQLFKTHIVLLLL